MMEEASKLSADPAAVAVERMLWLAAQQRYADVRDLLVSSDAAQLDPRVVSIGARVLASSAMKEHLAYAQSLFERMLAGEPERLDALLGLAQVAFRMGDMGGAERAYRRVLSVDPYHQQALNDLAWIIGVAGDKTAEAMELADRGVDRYPGDPHLLDTRGALLIRLERWTEARRNFEDCLAAPTIVPTTRAKANLRLARVYLRLGEPRAAAESLSKAEAVDREQRVLSDTERKELDELKPQTAR
jgi:tetratricopeptide (TPR) repeat protein